MLKVCGHRILLKPFTLEEVDETYKRAKAVGIEIPELEEKRREQNAIDKAIVISVGGTAWRDFGNTPWAEIGDLIIYPKYSGKWVEDPADKQKYLILNDDDVLCVVK